LVAALPGTAQLVRFRIKKRVQRLLNRCPHYFIQMRLYPAFINLHLWP
jgi:hypothetical protein